MLSIFMVTHFVNHLNLKYVYKFNRIINKALKTKKQYLEKSLVKHIDSVYLL